MNTRCTPLADWPAFDAALAETQAPLPLFRNQLKSAREALKTRFQANEPIDQLVREHSDMVDQLLIRAWQRLIDQQQSGIALVAVGGYGRRELHPASDIDLLILTDSGADIERHSAGIEQFLLFLWDMGLEVGHSTRSLDDCVRQATDDITVVTNLMEARHLSGDEALFGRMKEVVGPQNIWPGLDFYRAKRDEQIARHHRFHDTAYNLEPNIKENPGGLRDLQVIGWVAKRHFGVETLHGLVNQGFLTEQEYTVLVEAQNFLWRIRFALHILTNRREDRLLFDHQRDIAAQFGYQDKNHRLAVEHFMKDYYRTVLELSRLNEMLLALFEEKILYADDVAPATQINEHFQSRHGNLEVVHDGVFREEPATLLELFVVMAHHPELRGISAGTIRLIREHRYLIDDDFRQNPRCRELFIDLFHHGIGLTHELRRMNRYGILAAYLPVFGKIVGQMQHDLFHVYTVDEHTMFVVRNLRRFTVPEHAHEFPLCSQVIQRIEKQEILTIAAFFHDIAKGRGGDHSTLGAVDAVNFCRDHGISEQDTGIIRWLVENHLIMSTTAQRKDISDPDVIAEFAALVGNQNRLNCIYLLTVADIRATSPELWNSWKDALLAELYRATTRALRRGLDTPIDQESVEREHQQKALDALQDLGFDEGAIEDHWARLGHDYFLRHSADEITWHTRAILGHIDEDTPLVLVRSETHRGGTEIFVYARNKDYLFALLTSALEQLGLNITDARVITSNDHYALDTFLVLEESGDTISDAMRLEEIHKQLAEALRHPEHVGQPSRQPTRQQKHFTIPTEVLFRDDPSNPRTQMEVITNDRVGLLAQIARALLECEVLLQNAKIATFGERAEDIFFITDKHDQPLPEELQVCLRGVICSLLED
jgi:[protein-PII] uridylyltransferase